MPVSSNFLIWPWHISSSSFPGKARGAFVFSPGPSQGTSHRRVQTAAWLCHFFLSLQNGYGSIPINTIFRGMNIHLPAILMWTKGVQGFDTLPNPAKSPCLLLQFSTFNMEVSLKWGCLLKSSNHCTVTGSSTINHPLWCIMVYPMETSKHCLENGWIFTWPWCIEVPRYSPRQASTLFYKTSQLLYDGPWAIPAMCRSVWQAMADHGWSSGYD